MHEVAFLRSMEISGYWPKTEVPHLIALRDRNDHPLPLPVCTRQVLGLSPWNTATSAYCCPFPADIVVLQISQNLCVVLQIDRSQIVAEVIDKKLRKCIRLPKGPQNMRLPS